MRLTVNAAQISDPGGREINQDSLGAAELPAGTCWVVADGLGGHRGGEVASRLAVNAIVETFRRMPSPASATLERALGSGHERIVAARTDDPELQQMSTTVVALATDFTHAIWAHVGDSRLYFFRGGRLAAQTRDHSVPQVLADGGEIDPSAIRNHPDRSKLLKSLGSGDFRPSVSEPVALGHGDAFLLCTDGFWEFVTEAEMEADLAASATPEEWLKAMYPRLRARIPPDTDNYTALAVYVGDRSRAGVIPPASGGVASRSSWLLTANLTLFLIGLMTAALITAVSAFLLVPVVKRWMWPEPPPRVIPQQATSGNNPPTPPDPSQSPVRPPETPGPPTADPPKPGETAPPGSSDKGGQNPVPGAEGRIVPGTSPQRPPAGTPPAQEDVPSQPGQPRESQAPPLKPEESSTPPPTTTAPKDPESGKSAPVQPQPLSDDQRARYKLALAQFESSKSRPGRDKRELQERARDAFEQLRRDWPHDQLGDSRDQPYAPNYHLGKLAQELARDKDEGRKKKCEIWDDVDDAVRKTVWKKDWNEDFDKSCGGK